MSAIGVSLRGEIHGRHPDGCRETAVVDILNDHTPFRASLQRPFPSPTCIKVHNHNTPTMYILCYVISLYVWVHISATDVPVMTKSSKRLGGWDSSWVSPPSSENTAHFSFLLGKSRRVLMIQWRSQATILSEPAQINALDCLYPAILPPPPHTHLIKTKRWYRHWQLFHNRWQLWQINLLLEISTPLLPTSFTPPISGLWLSATASTILKEMDPI